MSWPRDGAARPMILAMLVMCAAFVSADDTPIVDRTTTPTPILITGADNFTAPVSANGAGNRRLLGPADPAGTLSKVADGTTAMDLAKALLSGSAGVTINTATYTGSPQATCLITFPAAHYLASDFEKGAIVLTTGDCSLAFVTNNQADSSTLVNNVPGDADLSALVGGANTNDASILTISLTATKKGKLTFQYVFASEEYNEYVSSSFNDVFALYVDGVNVAVVPGTSPPVPVSINNVNGGTDGLTPNPLFVNNDPSNGAGNLAIAYDGIVKKLATKDVPVSVGQSLTLKLAIADTGDSSWDSGVYLEASSLFINEPPVAVIVTPPSPLKCTSYTLNPTGSFDPDGVLTATSYSWVVSGGALSKALTFSIPKPVLVYGGPNGLRNLPKVAPPQEYTVQLTVTDLDGASTTATTKVIVPLCNAPPVAKASLESAVVQCPGKIKATAVASFDPDGDKPLTYSWVLKRVKPGGGLEDVATVNKCAGDPTVELAGVTTPGTYKLFLTVTDPWGASSSLPAPLTVVVKPCPPSCGCAVASPPTLCAPDYKQRKLVKVLVSDPYYHGKDAVKVKVTGVTQDEPTPTKKKCFGFCPTAVIVDGGVKLAAERADNGDGRVYRISFTATNKGGASCTGYVDVCVPKNSKKKTCVNSGQKWEATKCAAF